MSRSERKDIIVKSELSFDRYGRFKDFVEEVNVNFNEIPEKYRSNACLDITVYDDYDGFEVKMEVSYQRPETEEEHTKRIMDEETTYQILEANERKMYLQLKKKFEKE